MTANSVVTIWCDQSPIASRMSCGKWIEGDSAKDARAIAKSYGWLVAQPGGKDYCPNHHGKRKDAEAQ